MFVNEKEGELCSSHWDFEVLWTGHPAAFGCGHTRASAVIAEHKERVGQMLCSGVVLFSWPCIGRSGESKRPFRLNQGFVVSVHNDGKAPCRGDTFLAAHVSC